MKNFETSPFVQRKRRYEWYAWCRCEKKCYAFTIRTLLSLLSRSWLLMRRIWFSICVKRRSSIPQRQFHINYHCKFESMSLDTIFSFYNPITYIEPYTIVSFHVSSLYFLQNRFQLHCWKSIFSAIICRDAAKIFYFELWDRADS